MIVTNGDNLYGNSFLSSIAAESSKGKEYDIYAFDFYSRYTRVTLPACERFAADPLYGNCKKNNLAWCQVDLGASAIHWKKFIEEQRSYGGINNTFYGLGEEHNDGLLMEELVEGGWKVKKMEGECLFVHSPSIQSCAWRGGVWDDRDIVGSEGGTCLTLEEADKVLRHDRNAEEVNINVMHADNYLKRYPDVIKTLDEVKCIRRKDYKSERVWGQAMQWFSEACTDPIDLEAFSKQTRVFYGADYDNVHTLDESIVT